MSKRSSVLGFQGVIFEFCAECDKLHLGSKMINGLCLECQKSNKGEIKND